MDWGSIYEVGKSAVSSVFNIGKSFAKSELGESIKGKVTDKALQKLGERFQDNAASAGTYGRTTVDLGGRYSLSVSEPASPGATAGAPINSAAAYSARWSRIMANARANAKGTTVRSPVTITSRINRPKQRRIT